MANILFCWELGGGLGHLTPIKPAAEALAERGHTVSIASCDLSKCGAVAISSSISVFQAPVLTGRIRPRVEPPSSFAEILFNKGFSNRVVLEQLVRGWRSLFGALQPDVLLFDHSPTALLASYGLNVIRLPFGLPFTCPPPVSWLPDWRPSRAKPPGALQASEKHVLDNANSVLVGHGCAPLEMLSDLFTRTDELLLTSYSEFDPFPERPSSQRYWGTWEQALGQPPSWPRGSGPKVFAYVKPFPKLPELLQALVNFEASCVVYCPGIPQRLAQRFAHKNINFSPAPVRMSCVTDEADMGVLGGTHFTTTEFLLKGKPVLGIPLFLEQRLNTNALERIGAGKAVSIREPAKFGTAIREILEQNSYAAAAQKFMSKYQESANERGCLPVVERIESYMHAYSS